MGNKGGEKLFKMRKPFILLRSTIPALLLAASLAEGQTVTVHNTAELRTALQAATPGATIALRPGSYRGGLFISGLAGKANSPITIAGAVPTNPPVFSGGGSEAIHLSDCAHLVLRDIAVTGYPGNGINADDGGTFATPTHHLRFEHLTIDATGPIGNNDGLKLSGLNHFTVAGCTFRGWGGSAIDMVGCHNGVIEDCAFLGRPGFSQDSGVQLKGGTTNVLVRRSFFKHAGPRAINLGGSTDLPFFRPSVGNFEARAIEIAGNRFVGSEAPIAWVTADGGRVHHNTFVFPGKWVMRILQESTDPRFAPCHGGSFERNLVVFDSRVGPFVNVGPGTDPASFVFRRNAWFQTDGSRIPVLPTPERNGVYQVDPQLSSLNSRTMRITSTDPRLAQVGADHYE